MQIKFIDTIEVIDNIIEDKNLINDLKGESTIPSTIKGQDIFNLTNPQKKFYEIASKLVINYCFQNNINFDNLKLSNFQKGKLQKYDHSKVSNHLYHPQVDQHRNYPSAELSQCQAEQQKETFPLFYLSYKCKVR